MLFLPRAIEQTDLFPWKGGLVPCEIGFDVLGVFRRTGTEIVYGKALLGTFSADFSFSVLGSAK